MEKFKMNNCNFINRPLVIDLELSKEGDHERVVDPTNTRVSFGVRDI